MKTALLHYWLTNVRGGEKVLAALGEMFPEADVFTHAFIPSRVSCLKSHRVWESFIASLPFGRRHPQAYLPLMPMATRALNLDGYDLIISSESGPIKGICKPRGARHVCYCHTPMRYLWDMHDEYYRDAGLGGKLAMKLLTPYLRKEDLKSADSVWKRILPKLLHSNPNGRECISYSDEKRTDQERRELDLEERWLKEKGRGHNARHFARYASVAVFALLLLIGYFVLKEVNRENPWRTRVSDAHETLRSVTRNDEWGFVDDELRGKVEKVIRTLGDVLAK